MKIHNETDFSLICLFAFRYAITRKSYAGSLTADWIIDNIDNIADTALKSMKKDVIEGLNDGLITDIEAVIWTSFVNTIDQIKGWNYET